MVYETLACINAVNKLKTLKLTGSANICNRTCLKSLRLSIAFKHIDLSLVRRHESAIVKPEPRMFEAVVVSCSY